MNGAGCFIMKWSWALAELDIEAAAGCGWEGEMNKAESLRDREAKGGAQLCNSSVWSVIL